MKSPCALQLWLLAVLEIVLFGVCFFVMGDVTPLISCGNTYNL